MDGLINAVCECSVCELGLGRKLLCTECFLQKLLQTEAKELSDDSEDSDYGEEYLALQ